MWKTDNTYIYICLWDLMGTLLLGMVQFGKGAIDLVQSPCNYDFVIMIACPPAPPCHSEHPPGFQALEPRCSPSGQAGWDLQRGAEDDGVVRRTAQQRTNAHCHRPVGQTEGRSKATIASGTSHEQKKWPRRHPRLSSKVGVKTKAISIKLSEYLSILYTIVLKF